MKRPDAIRAVWQELGTKHIPPRSFLVSAAKKSEADLAKIARKYIHSAWASAKSRQLTPSCIACDQDGARSRASSLQGN
jgi:hypothetical protein